MRGVIVPRESEKLVHSCIDLGKAKTYMLVQGKMDSAGCNTRVPIVRELHADLDTPISVYLKLASGPYSYLLESAEGGDRWGRYSIIGLPCREIIRVAGDVLTLEKDAVVVEEIQTADPLAWIEMFRQRYVVSPMVGTPRFTGGLVGCAMRRASSPRRSGGE